MTDAVVGFINKQNLISRVKEVDIEGLGNISYTFLTLLILEGPIERGSIILFDTSVRFIVN